MALGVFVVVFGVPIVTEANCWTLHLAARKQR